MRSRVGPDCVKEVLLDSQTESKGRDVRVRTLERVSFCPSPPSSPLGTPSSPPMHPSSSQSVVFGFQCPGRKRPAPAIARRIPEKDSDRPPLRSRASRGPVPVAVAEQATRTQNTCCSPRTVLSSVHVNSRWRLVATVLNNAPLENAARGVVWDDRGFAVDVSW